MKLINWLISFWLFYRNCYGLSGIYKDNVLTKTTERNRLNLTQFNYVNQHVNHSSDLNEIKHEIVRPTTWMEVPLTEPNQTHEKPSIKQHFMNYLTRVKNISANEKNRNSTRFANESQPFLNSTDQSIYETTLPLPLSQNTTDGPLRNKDQSKQLQLQFVLDCKMVDPKTKQEIAAVAPEVKNEEYSKTTTPAPTTTTTRTSTKKRKTTRKPTSTTATPKIQATTPKVILPTTTQKVKVKNVYVDPPGLSVIGNAFENIYNYFEDSLVDKEIKKVKPKKTFSPDPIPYENLVPNEITTRASPISNLYPKPQQQSIPNRIYYIAKPGYGFAPQRYKRTTLLPNSYITIPGSGNNPNSLMTQIHVTSEYNGNRPYVTNEIPVTAPTPIRKHKDPEDSEEEDDYYGSFSLNGLSENSDAGSDSDSEENENDSESDSAENDDDDDESSEYAVPTDKSKKTKKHSENSDSDEESHEETDFAGAMDRYGQYFGNFFTSVGKLVPKLPSFKSFGGGASSEPSIEKISKSTAAPKIEARRPKHPIYAFDDDYGFSDENKIDSDDVSATPPSSSWFNPFFFGSREDTTLGPSLTTTASTSQSFDFSNWFGSQENSHSLEDSSGNNSTWFFGLFGGQPSSTSTSRPFLAVSNPMHKPQNWLGILAQHLASTTTKKPPTEIDPQVPKHVSYRNHQLWRLLPSTEEQLKFLEYYRWTPEGAKLQWWKGPTLRGPTDIVIPSKMIADVKESISYEDIPYDVVMWDLEKAIMYENPRMSKREKVDLERSQGHPLTWYRYHEYDDIVKYLQYLQRKHSDIVELIHIGRSFEARPIIVVKITGEENDTTDDWKNTESIYDRRKKKSRRPAIFIEAGTHAREWIAPAVATWLIDNLIKNIGKNDSIGETIRSVDWFIMPILNPDGYVFSHEYDRLWRKTRSKHPEEDRSIFMKALQWLRPETEVKNEAECFGTDLNRNWNYMWNEKGASRSKCSEFYAGPRAFSEPETKALAKFLEENKKYLKIFLSLHSYGQILTYPTTANASYNYIKSDDLFDMAQVAIETIRGISGSTRYMIDNTNEMMYSRSGSSDSYALYNLNVKYSYTLELRDTGTHGFLLPPSYIEPTAKETFEIIKGMIDYM